jgi:hypothetical protein
MGRMFDSTQVSKKKKYSSKASPVVHCAAKYCKTIKTKTELKPNKTE